MTKEIHIPVLDCSSLPSRAFLDIYKKSLAYGEDQEKFKVIDPETGEVILYLNGKLVKEKKIKGRKLTALKKLYIESHNIEKQMRELDPETQGRDLRRLLKNWRKVEYQIQEGWGFRKNKNYHADYKLPHCTCPIYDNDDYKGTNMRWVTAGCVYHDPKGKIVKKVEEER